MKRECKQKIIEGIKSYLLDKKDILFAYLFGSFIDEEIDYFRDIDIAVFLRGPYNRNIMEIEITLANEIEQLLDYEYHIDMVVMNNKNTALIAKIIDGELLFTKDEDFWADYVTYIAMDYNDVSYYRDIFLKEAYIEG